MGAAHYHWIDEMGSNGAHLLAESRKTGTLIAKGVGNRGLLDNIGSLVEGNSSFKSIKVAMINGA
jgi:hypothetical protein